MDADSLYEQLKKSQEPRGYYFNRDKDKTMFLIDGLITNLQRYGYMCCPCRLAKEDREADRDIICPCDYREPDVNEFGSCYCGLYVSRKWNEGEIERVFVPERRPVEKC